MVKIRFEFNGRVLCRGKTYEYKKDVIASSRDGIAKEIKKDFIKENKLDKHERLVIIAKHIREKERTLV